MTHEEVERRIVGLLDRCDGMTVAPGDGAKQILLHFAFRGDVSEEDRALFAAEAVYLFSQLHKLNGGHGLKTSGPVEYDPPEGG